VLKKSNTTVSTLVTQTGALINEIARLHLKKLIESLLNSLIMTQILDNLLENMGKSYLESIHLTVKKSLLEMRANRV
jgi:hypothetical protein